MRGWTEAEVCVWAGRPGNNEKRVNIVSLSGMWNLVYRVKASVGGMNGISTGFLIVLLSDVAWDWD